MQINIPHGFTLYSAIKYAKNTCDTMSRECVDFIFNGIQLYVYRDSNEYDILEIYRLKRKCGECTK